MIARPSRRQFVQLAAGALALSSGATNAQAAPSTHVFFHQTGSVRKSGFYLGALITENPQQHRDAVAAMREATSYRRTLRYKSTDTHKIPFCHRWIDYFVATRGIRFVGGPVKLEDWPDLSRKKDIVYFAAHKRLLDLAGLPADTSLLIHTLNVGFEARTLALFKSFQSNLPWPATAGKEHPTEEPLLQIADLFTGSLQDGSDSKTKLKLIGYLRKSLNVERLDETSLRNSSLFRVREIVA